VQSQGVDQSLIILGRQIGLAELARDGQNRPERWGVGSLKMNQSMGRPLLQINV